MTPDLLASYATVMRANRILRVEGEEEVDATDFTIELSPTAFDGLPAPNVQSAAVPNDLGAGEKKCACGHLQDSEHLNGLCIAAACPPSVCHPEAKA